MSERSEHFFINFPVFAGGIALMLAGYGLYHFFSPSPHGYLEIFFAMPVFCLGMAFTGAAFVTGSAQRFRALRLCIGWAVIALAASPFLYLAWLFIG